MRGKEAKERESESRKGKRRGVEGRMRGEGKREGEGVRGERVALEREGKLRGGEGGICFFIIILELRGFQTHTGELLWLFV